MPITQDRLKAVVDAAQSIYATYATLCADIANQVVAYQAGKLSLPDFLEWCAMRGVRPDAAVASELIVLNREQFRLMANWSANEREARRLARRRAERGQGHVRRRIDEPPTAEPPPTPSLDAAQRQALADEGLAELGDLEFEPQPPARESEVPETFLDPETRKQIQRGADAIEAARAQKAVDIALGIVRDAEGNVIEEGGKGKS